MRGEINIVKELEQVSQWSLIRMDTAVMLGMKGVFLQYLSSDWVNGKTCFSTSVLGSWISYTWNTFS